MKEPTWSPASRPPEIWGEYNWKLAPETVFQTASDLVQSALKDPIRMQALREVKRIRYSLARAIFQRNMARGTQQSAQEDGPHKASYEKTALSDLNEFVELDSKGKNRIREFAQKAKENPNLGRAYEEIDGRVSELVSLTIPEKYRSHSSLRADQEINIIKLLHFYETGDYGFFDESIDLEGQDRTGREEK